jgi:hypothetical protein
MIDGRNLELNDVEMVAHVGQCTECADFYHALLAIDAGLRQVPVLPISGSLVHSLREIGTPHVHPSPGWKPDIERAAVYLVPGILLWASQWALPAYLRPYLLALMTFIGTFTLMTSIFRPRILGSRRS